MLTADSITVNNDTYELVDAAARKDIETLKEAVAISDLVTTSGTFLTIKNAAKGKALNKVVVYGTLDPIDSLGLNVTGRNILPDQGYTTKTTNGITCTRNDDNSLTFTGASTATDWTNFDAMQTGESLIYPPGTYYISIQALYRYKATDDSFGTIWGTKLGSSSYSSDSAFKAHGGYYTFSSTWSGTETWLNCMFYGEAYGEASNFVGGTTVIDLQGNTVAALEDGTRDELVVDKNGTVVLYKRTDGDERTISLGSVSMPVMPEDVNCIWANSAKTPTVEVTYALPSEEGPVVLYTEQTLTANQQAQVRKNIGLSELGATTDYSAYGLPMLYLTGDTTGMTKKNAKTLDYEYGDLSGTCTVKWQGSSSVNYPKKNYTIKFDEAFEVVEGWGAEKKYCFKANYIDHTHARNLVSAKLWGRVVKSRSGVDSRLTALVNGGAVDGFPCVVMLNGEFHGLYTWNIPKDGWMYGMEDSTTETQAILCAGNSSQCTSFKALFTGTEFDVEYVSDEDNADWVTTSFNRLIQACIDSDGTDLDTTVAQYLDLNSAIDYYIFTCLLRGQDMTVKNYLMVTYDGVKWFFGGYDMDSTYGLYWNGQSFDAANSGTMPAYYASIHRVMELIKTYKKDALKARYAELRASVMSEDSVATAFSNFMADIPTPLLVDDVRKWPTIPSTSASNLAQIVSWYERRCKAVDAAIEAL